MKQPTYEQLRAELEETRYRLEEANDMLEAIRNGEVDALVVKADDGHQLYTLRSSDEAYRIFIEQMTAGAVTLNLQGAILYCNSCFAAMVGLPLEKVIGKHFCNFFRDTQHDACLLLLNDAWEAAHTRELSLFAAGSAVPVLLSMQILTLDDGPAMSVIITDLSQQKAQQGLLEEKNRALEEARQVADKLNNNLEQTVRERTRELYDNQERLSRILETMAEGVGIINTGGQLTYANPMARKILGLKQNALKEHLYDSPQWANLRLDGTPLPDTEHPMTITLQTGEPVYDHEIAIQPPDGERFYISINAAPIRDESGVIVGSIGTFMDVTHRRKLLQQKDEFISVASHELKTPVTSLKASLQLLDRMKTHSTPPVYVKLIEQANRSLSKVSVLIDDLLNASKVTEGKLQLNKHIIVLQELIADCCPHVRAEGIYEITLEGDKNILVEADADKVDQVLDNLVNNAIKYAPASKIIQIGIEKSGNFAKISVSDRGPGIAPEQLSRLFERYYRVDNSSLNYSGLGLGLYICSEIVRKHGGEIGITSTLGVGSTFWFTLPLA